MPGINWIREKSIFHTCEKMKRMQPNSRIFLSNRVWRYCRAVEVKNELNLIEAEAEAHLT